MHIRHLTIILPILHFIAIYSNKMEFIDVTFAVFITLNSNKLDPENLYNVNTASSLYQNVPLSVFLILANTWVICFTFIKPFLLKNKTFLLKKLFHQIQQSALKSLMQ